MCKAVLKAYEAYPLTESNRYNHEINAKRVGYQQGYEQAEKDLELTWEDIMLIHRHIKDAMNYHLYKMMEGVEGQKIVYQEVLKRFKEHNKL